MRKFNDFSPKDDNKEQNYMNVIRGFAQKYEGASQSELISAMLAEAEKRKRNGTLSDQDIDNFAKMLRPMLNPSQQKELDNVISKIKNIK